MPFNKKELDQSFKLFSIEGYTFKKEIMGYSWTKEYHNREEKIIIGYRGYPDSYVAYTPTVTIYFNEVENIINPLLDKFNIQNRYGNTTIQKSLIKIEGVDYSKLETEINNQSTFDMVINEINKIISLGAMPFFEKYASLETLKDDLSKMNEDELSNFLSGIIGIKLPLIKRLTNSNDFKSELLKRNDFYTDEALKYPQYFKDHEKVFEALFSEDLKAV